jgi:hypothetical protein
MRAVCESCAAAQPTDWTPGDLCTSCGDVARRELRCHWCAAFTPEGRFCRSCGAETVADELYAPARMLKAAGVDQFSVKDRLAALDGDHIAHLTRLYQRQAALAASRVDELAWVEQFLLGAGWSIELENALTGLLPIPDGDVANVLGVVDRVAMRADDPANRLRSLITTASNSLTSLLAAVALVRHGWITSADHSDLAQSSLHHPDQRVVDEGSLAFGHWRSRFAPVRMVSSQQLIGALITCTRRDDATVALSLLGESDEVDRALLGDPDPDRAFGAALALGVVEPLTAALRIPARRRAAALVLAGKGHGEVLGKTLGELDEDTLEEVLDRLRYGNHSFPTLREQLWLLARTGGRRLRSYAVSLLVTIGQPEDAVPLVQLDPPDTSTVQEVLQRMVLSDVETLALCRLLVHEQRFRISQYGVSDLAENGRLPDDFVPGVWGQLADDDQRKDLLRFAEEQLNARNDDALHRFLINVVFAPRGVTTAEVREEGWWSLLRWYARKEYASKGPLALDDAVLARFFDGGTDEFIDRFVGVLEGPELDDHRTLAECLGNLLRYSPEAGLPSVAARSSAFARLIEGLQRVLGDSSRNQSLRCDVVRFLENNVRADASQLAFVLGILAPFAHDDDLEFEVTTTMARLNGE